jgi:hypothetical protein
MTKPYVHKTDRRNCSHKPQTLPVTFQAGFLSTLDGRTDLAKALRANYATIVEDIGGQAEVGHVKSALVERFVWLEAILQTLEHEMAHGEIDKGEALGRWIQAVNSLAGLARTLGVERRNKSMPWLAALGAVVEPGSNGASSDSEAGNLSSPRTKHQADGAGGTDR